MKISKSGLPYVALVLWSITTYCKMEVDGNLNDAILEPRRELLSSRRRREDVLSALDDDFYDNFDDE